MSEEKFDAIVVGGGLAGLSAAYAMAQAGLDVMVVERGKFCGAKNSSGGRLYGHSLEKLIPNFAEEAPIERKIVKERIALMTEATAMTIEYSSGKLGEQSCASYSVLRAKFDKWLADKAEEAGAMVAAGLLVEDIIIKDGQAIGISCGGEEVFGDVVILADGVNSLLAQKLGMQEELDPTQVAVGVKEVISLDPQVINERFGVADGEGTAMMMAGDPTCGNLGGAFLYTNKDSVSLGIVTTISDIGRVDTSVPDMVERVKNHPVIKPLIAGGKLQEYSAHLVTEGGYKMMPKLVKDGVLVVGDAAAFVINLGYTVRGMDFAIESGRLAAEAVIKAKAKGDFSAEGLACYKTLLEDSFVLKELKIYQNFPSLLECHAVFNDIPKMADEFASELLTVDGRTPMAIPMIAMLVLAKNGGLAGLVDLGSKALEAF